MRVLLREIDRSLYGWIPKTVRDIQILFAVFLQEVSLRGSNGCLYPYSLLRTQMSLL
jgi:hypothetical protein